MAAAGLTPTSPITDEEGTVEMPLLARIANSPASPSSTGEPGSPVSEFVESDESIESVDSEEFIELASSPVACESADSVASVASEEFASEASAEPTSSAESPPFDSHAASSETRPSARTEDANDTSLRGFMPTKNGHDSRARNPIAGVQSRESAEVAAMAHEPAFRAACVRAFRYRSRRASFVQIRSITHFDPSGVVK
ncbi:hypothetical protein ACNOYE_30010 [Nannocystaceae bacterium ST9]